MPRVPIILAAIAFALGCGKPADPASATNTPTAATGQAAPAPADYSATLAELTQALRKYSAEKRRVPDSLSELVTSGHLSQLPAAPAGQSFAIDPKQLKVVLR